MTSSLGALILDFWSIGILFSSVSWNKALISQQKFVKAHLFCFDNISDNYSFCENGTKYWIRNSFVLHSLIQSFTEISLTNITNMEVFANCNEGVTEWIFKVYVSPSPEFQVSIESALLSTTLDLTPSFSSAASSSSLSLFWRRPPPASLGFTYQLVVQHSQKKLLSNHLHPRPVYCLKLPQLLFKSIIGLDAEPKQNTYVHHSNSLVMLIWLDLQFQ